LYRLILGTSCYALIYNSLRLSKTLPHEFFTNYFDLKYALEDTMGRDVDLVEEKAIRNPIFRRNIDRTKMKIYG
jgi:predicted nucleotidyltransferase